MALILIAVTFSGLLASKLFHILHMESMAIRYPLAVLFSYLFFFVCVRLWLMWVTWTKSSTSGSSGWIDIPVPSGSSGGGGASLPRGGGGNFSGAGASGSFNEEGASAGARLVSAVPAGDVSDSPASGSGSTLGAAADILDGDSVGAIVAIVILVTLVATILGSAVYVITEAPLILSEAAFDGLLAASLARRTRNFGEEWVGGIFRQTWKPFVVTLAVAFFAALVLHHFFPMATSLTEVLRSI